MAITKTSRRNKIRRGIRSKISGTKVKPRVCIFKSNKFIYAQVIDDLTGSTLAAASSAEIDKSKNANVDIANQVGKKLAEKAVSNGLSEVVFDRSGYLYHGKVKALAEGAREGGLKF